MNLRYNIRYENEDGLVRVKQVVGEKAKIEFEEEVEKDPHRKLIISGMHTV